MAMMWPWHEEALPKVLVSAPHLGGDRFLPSTFLSSSSIKHTASEDSPARITRAT